MMVINRFKTEFSLVVITLLLCNSFLISSPITVLKVHAQEGYTYYGYVPAQMWQFNLTDENNLNSGWRRDNASTSRAGLVAVIGIKNNTSVQIYSLDNGSLVSEATINSMQKHYVVFQNGTSFRVETSELASVFLLNYGSVPLSNATSGPLPDTFYQDTSGAYIGKEFVLLGSGNGYSIGYAIFALEKAEVTVTTEDGDQKLYSLDVNTWKEMMWQPFKTYKIKSTGNIMIQSGRPPDIWGDARTFYVPAVEGGFVGKTFYSWSASGGSWDFTESYGFRVSATQNSKITVFNLETKAPIITKDVLGGMGFGLKPQAPAIIVQSNQPVTFSYFHNGSIANANGHLGIYGAYGSGVGYFGVKPNEDTPFYLSVDSYVQAFVFASEDTQVTIDGITQNIMADSLNLLTPGPGNHVIRANKNIVVETLNWPNTPDYQGLVYNGAQIPSVQTVDVVPKVTLTPLGESFPIMYVLIGAIVAVIGVIVAFLFMKGRGKK